ncbi:MAG TPA: hypothetical protein VMT28_07710 [Terriglobales bacterium]|nr:hypothetical protein [Terriglobales bacterium]
MTADPNTPLPGIPPSSLGVNLPSPDRTAGPATARPPQDPEAERYTSFELWLHRITVLLFVLVCASVGVLLIIVPWTDSWTDNRLLLVFPGLREIVANGFVRGVCSGLGVLDIWIGFWEAVHYHEDKRT